MFRLINYCKLAFWIAGFFVTLTILCAGADKIVKLILNQYLNIYWSDLEAIVTAVVVIALIGYWYNLVNKNDKYVNLICDISERYKIIQQISEEKVSKKASAKDFFKIVGMEMDINKANKQRSKYFWWTNWS